MGPRVTIDRESIIMATLDLIRAGGWDAVSARSLASRLGASTMPIYSAIGSMEELKKAVLERALELLFHSQRIPRTGNDSLDLAVGYVIFARDEPEIFRFIEATRGEIGKGMLLEVSKDESAPGSIAKIGDIKAMLESLKAPETQEDFVLDSWIFANGLAALMASGTLAMEEEEITRHLRDAGGAFYLYARHKEERA